MGLSILGVLLFWRFFHDWFSHRKIFFLFENKIKYVNIIIVVLKVLTSISSIYYLNTIII